MREVEIVSTGGIHPLTQSCAPLRAEDLLRVTAGRHVPLCVHCSGSRPEQHLLPCTINCRL
jgi:hypothetical protein